MSQEKEIVARSRAFAIAILYFASLLPNTAVAVVLTRQLVRAGTSIGANIEEAQSAISKREFTQKMFFALKEARETRYWLRLILESDMVGPDKIDPLLTEVQELISVLTTIAKNSRGD